MQKKAPRAGLEPATYWLTASRYCRLSYRGVEITFFSSKSIDKTANSSNAIEGKINYKLPLMSRITAIIGE
jgi:hypothetical protein